MEQHRAQYSVRRMCFALKVSPGGYYAWRTRPESARSIRHRHLTEQIKESFEASRQTYGAVRVWHDLREEGERVGRNTVALLMRRVGLMPRPVRKFRVTTDSRRTTAAPNVLERNFSVSEPNRSGVTDITFIPTREGWLYLCAVVDLYSRAIIGWSMSSRMKSDLVSGAMQMAIQMRRPPSGLLVHSDQGSQYGSDEYQRLLKKA